MTKNKKKTTTPSAVAIHGSHEDGIHHPVGFWNLRVLIVPDGKAFFAQCHEIDYAAQGETLEEVKSNFEKGFSATVFHHLRMFGSLDEMMHPVGGDMWQDLIGSTEGMKFTVSHTALHRVLNKRVEVLSPYQNIEYAQAMAA